jgi:uncharacterized protein with HEPN domain
MRSEKLYLVDILEAAEAVQRFIDPVSKVEFLADELRQSGVLQKLTVIGEASARLPGEFQTAHNEIEWADIIGFRNIAVHAYFSKMWEIVWETAVSDVPKLRNQISTILETEYSNDNEETK